MIRIEKYCKDRKGEWDTFVTNAKNGTFLFLRNYIEYHSDRFIDYSLMVFKGSKVIALLPANIVDNTVYSHQGLTFGGIIHSKTSTSLEYLSIFNMINKYLYDSGVETLTYKAIPQIYKSGLGDEEYYCLFRVKAELISCNLSSCIKLKSRIKISRNRIRNHNKSIANGLLVEKSNDYSAFWSIMEKNMEERFGKNPVHTCQEISHLKENFPQNIELWQVSNNTTTLAGAVIFKYKNIIKVQYAHASNEGKKAGAIDAIYFNLIERYTENFDYIDFGTSNTKNGVLINEGLLNQKESFGARGVVFNTYQYNTKNIIA